MQGIVRGGLNDGESNIKSIQRGTTSFTAAATTKDITISQVDISKSIVRVSMVVTAQDQTPHTQKTIGCGARLTTSTNLNLAKLVGGKDITVSWEVIEFNNVKTIQRGILDSSQNFTFTVSITAVDLNKSLLFTNSKAYNSYVVYSEKPTYTERFSSSTQLEFKQDGIGASEIYWEVIQFN